MIKKIKELSKEIHNALTETMQDNLAFLAELQQLNKCAKRKAAEVDEIVKICNDNGITTSRTDNGYFDAVVEVPEYNGYKEELFEGLSYISGRRVKNAIERYLEDVAEFENVVYNQLKNKRDALAW